jgi:hypothetical protein
MEVKFLEIRFGSAFIPAVALRAIPRNQKERYILSRAGFSSPGIFLAPLQGIEFPSLKAFGFTLNYLERHWDAVSSGDVIDVDYLTGERDKPRITESVHYPVN